MSPIEKAHARAAALEALGVGQSANPHDVRAAWRRIAFATHPDRNGGTADAFARAKAAYDYLRGEADAAGGGASGACAEDRPATRGRPTVATRTDTLSPAAQAECRALLAAQPPGADTAAVDHVAQAVERRGRHLTYVIGTPLAPGLNRISVPAAVLQDHRRVRPAILTFMSAGSGAREIALPDGAWAALIPGARSVRLRFAAR